MSPEGQRGWYAKNADRCRARSKEWYAAHRQRARANNRKWREENPEKARECNRRWADANPTRIILARAKCRAKKAGIPFDLTLADVLVPELCPVLGVRLEWRGRRTDYSPSLDRIDNARGYVRGNVIVVSWRANRLKSDASSDELRRVAEFYRTK